MDPNYQLLKQSLLVGITLWLLQYALFYEKEKYSEDTDKDMHLLCMEDKLNHTNICRPKCENGYFSLPGMVSCDAWLTCAEIKTELHNLEPLAQGAVKTVYKANYRGYTVVYSVLLTDHYQDDFKHGLQMLRELNPSRHVTQLLGYCDDSFVTEYHPLGTAHNLDGVLNGPLAVRDDIVDVHVRFEICINYARVISFLHRSPVGTRVMCDSNDIDKTLSQFLVNPDLTLVANDLDALPEVLNGEGVKCGHRQLYGDFVAPEQLWPYEDKPFNDDLMPSYDEKTDIWKIPDVCNHLLGTSDYASFLQFHLHKVHKRCKEVYPKRRPTAEEVLNAYLEIKLKLLF